jgi:hypothetical protein
MFDPNNENLWMVPIASVFIAAASVGLALAAWWTTREKLRLDLFDRRFAIFKAAVDFSNILSVWTGSEEQLAARQLFARSVIESQFLFSKKSGIFAILGEMQEKSLRRFAADQLLARTDRGSMPNKCLEAADESMEALHWILFSAIPELTEKMKPFLNFHTLTTWPGFE